MRIKQNKFAKEHEQFLVLPNSHTKVNFYNYTYTMKSHKIRTFIKAQHNDRYQRNRPRNDDIIYENDYNAMNLSYEIQNVNNKSEFAFRWIREVVGDTNVPPLPSSRPSAL